MANPELRRPVAEPPVTLWSETARMGALESYRILDTPTHPDFDDIARLAAAVLDAPIAVINLIATERQWFKAEIGIGVRELPLDVSICRHAILQDDFLVIPDTRLDPRVDCNPLVTADDGLRFYAGALLRTPAGLPIGTVCVLDRAPRPGGITPLQRLTLEVLARQVMTQFELQQALRHRREDELRNRLIVESALEYAIITLDLSGIVTSWNAGAANLMGWEPAEICGQSYEALFTPEERAGGVPTREMEAALEHGRGADDRWHVRRDGTRFWASGELMPLGSDDDIPIGFLKILRDRTAQHDAMAELAIGEERTRMALEAGGLGAWEISQGLQTLDWDARTRDLFGQPAQGTLDYRQSFLARVHPEDRDRVARQTEAAFGPEGESTVDMEFRALGRADAERWVHARGAVVRRQDGDLRLVGTVRDITAAKAAEHHRQLLTEELQHRVKNTMAVVQSIVSQSLRTAATPAEARDAIGRRLITLGNAHDLLAQTSWTAAPIRAIASAATEVHGGTQSRIRIEGPALDLNARAALALAMTLHELTTNAVKYGALSNDGGDVAFTWAINDDAGDTRLTMAWVEIGGPAVVAPTRSGFGSRLMAALSSDLGSVGALDYHPDGVTWRLTTRLAEVTN